MKRRREEEEEDVQVCMFSLLSNLDKAENDKFLMTSNKNLYQHERKRFLINEKLPKGIKHKQLLELVMKIQKHVFFILRLCV